ncbi:MAG: aldolase/citrate lyase family protein [Gemmatimonadota bacterium]|nr:aldolase/citrate lyase family protein [Gemmatimonadota bacterium]
MPSARHCRSLPSPIADPDAPPAGCRSLPRAVLAMALAMLACSTPGQRAESGSDAPAATTGATDRPTRSTAPLVRLLADGQVLFGVFSGDRTAEQGAAMGRNRELDFVFYSLESGPFDIMTTKVYMSGIAEGSAPDPPHPLVLRVPAIRDGVEAAEANVAEALEAGVASIVFPHVESAEEAAIAVSAMGERLWPGNPDGDLVNILIIEDRVGVERADEIVGTEGVSIVFPGPGDLRRAYEGDMEAVEGAIRTVLAACRRHGVPCGITAGVDDIAERIAQGFRVFIVSDAAAVTVGRGVAGRG